MQTGRLLVSGLDWLRRYKNMAKEIGRYCGDTKPSSRCEGDVNVSTSKQARELKRKAEIQIADIIRKLESDIDMKVHD